MTGSFPASLQSFMVSAPSLNPINPVVAWLSFQELLIALHHTLSVAVHVTRFGKITS